MKEDLERTALILKSRLMGDKLGVIAKEHGLSVGRVRQILIKTERRVLRYIKNNFSNCVIVAEQEKEKIIAANKNYGFEEFLNYLNLIGASARTINCFRNEGSLYGCRTIGELKNFIETEEGVSCILRTPNFGRKSLNELKEILGAIS